MQSVHGQRRPCITCRISAIMDDLVHSLLMPRLFQQGDEVVQVCKINLQPSSRFEQVLCLTPRSSTTSVKKGQLVHVLKVARHIGRSISSSFQNYAHCPTHECTDVTHLNASIQRCELLVHSSHTALHILCKLATALCLVVRRSLAMIFLYAVQAMVLRSDTQLKAYDDPLDAASLAGILTEDYGGSCTRNIGC